MPLKSVLMALSVAVIWGINMLTVKGAVAEIPPLMLTAIRFAAVAVLLLPFTKIPHGRFGKLAILSVVFGTGHFGVLFLALSMLDAGPVAIIVLLGVPFSSMLATYFFNDRLGWKRLTGMTLAFVGVTTMFWDPTMTDVQLPLLLVVFAAFMWAVANVMIKKLGNIDTFQLNGWMALMAAPQLLLLSMVLEPAALDRVFDASWAAWANISFTVVMSSIVAYGFWYHLLKTQDVNAVVPWSLLAPVISVTGSFLIFNEPISTLKIIGGITVLAGVTVIMLRKPPQQQEQGMD
ncbi:DMT family transporter [Thalassospira alkalitolerans]|uniref:Multidrug transporter n=1 Tax=Thalassospira alkalitolerans TaxID=1293890 RepID=A0A1Y2LI62_9PROT|nr:EamA family transporter [Thalassospira alkalitolerans]OSQ49713.1 multidrug transporter [Thalassospira alkalitolerans]|tara:strand:+ start:1139 stop:2011 length:873 start_codon:yes stop_codon:yes gene_type:complete